MQQYEQETRRLVEDGQYQEALERTLWFHDNVLEHRPSMYGVRLSFALSDWLALGDKYPPAHEAMLRIRQEARDALLCGEGSYELFHDVCSFDRVLGEAEQSVDLFLSLEEVDSDLAKKCWRLIAPVVLNHQRYDIAKRYIADAHAVYQHHCQRYDENVKLYDDPTLGKEQFIRFNEENFVDEVMRLLGYVAHEQGEAVVEEIRSDAYSRVQDERLISS